MTIFRNSHREGANRRRENRRTAASSGKSSFSAKDNSGSATRGEREVPLKRPAGNRRVSRTSAGGETESSSSRRGLFSFNRPSVSTGVEDSASTVDSSSDGGGGEGTVSQSGAASRLKSILYSALRLLGVLVIIAAVVLGGRAAYRYALSASYFAVQHVTISGNERLSNAEILSAAGIAMEQNIFSIKLPEVTSKLMQNPWIMEARVRQKLPKTILIDIVERKPAVLVLFDVPYLVDEGGEIFKRWAPRDPLPDCVITGLTRRELVEDPEDTQKSILDAISLRERYNAEGNGRYARINEIHREVDGGFSVTVGDTPFYIRLGKSPYLTKLSRLAKLFRKLGKDGRQPLVVYLDNEKRPDRVTIKFKPEDTASPRSE